MAFEYDMHVVCNLQLKTSSDKYWLYDIQVQLISFYPQEMLCNVLKYFHNYSNGGRENKKRRN